MYRSVGSSKKWSVEAPDSFFSRSEHLQGDKLLSVRGLSLPRPGGGLLLDDVSFDLHAGEILALYGLMGAGRSELLESLVGLQNAGGRVELNGKPVQGGTGQRIAQGLTLVPEDRQRMGLVQSLSVAKNMTLASLHKFIRGVALSEQHEKREVTRMIGDLRVKVADPAQLITSLSGGNQQKVVISKCLLTDPKVLLLDEPTRGIDVAAKAEIFNLMNTLARSGLGVLFVSSELKEVMAMADRVLVMAKGRITAEFTRAELSEAQLVAASAPDLGLADLGKPDLGEGAGYGA